MDSDFFFKRNYNAPRCKPMVDGRNPAPVDRWFIPLFIGFQPSKVKTSPFTISGITKKSLTIIAFVIW